MADTPGSTGVSTLGESSDTITYSGNPFAETMHIGGGDTIFGAASSDTINFSSNTFAAAQEVPLDYDWGRDVLDFCGAAYTGSRVFGGMSEDTITFNLPRTLPEPDWKYNEVLFSINLRITLRKPMVSTTLILRVMTRPLIKLKIVGKKDSLLVM